MRHLWCLVGEEADEDTNSDAERFGELLVVSNLKYSDSANVVFWANAAVFSAVVVFWANAAVFSADVVVFSADVGGVNQCCCVVT